MKLRKWYIRNKKQQKKFNIRTSNNIASSNMKLISSIFVAVHFLWFCILNFYTVLSPKMKYYPEVIISLNNQSCSRPMQLLTWKMEKFSWLWENLGSILVSAVRECFGAILRFHLVSIELIRKFNYLFVIIYRSRGGKDMVKSLWM